uniref:Uncharacterized protein n=1 Tax=Amphora coffeiformis TaxID=265554 RepID=A0A7S3LB95_9STRA
MGLKLNPSTRAFLASPFPILGAWVLGGILSIVVPLSKWKKQKNQWYNYYGRYVEYENNQRAYEEQQKQYQEQQQYQYNNNGNYNNRQQGNYDRDGNWYPSCSWWQFKCRQQRMAYMQANGDNNNIVFPSWYAAIGGRTEEDDREREEMEGSTDEASGAVKFVYTWTLIVFIGMLIFGGITIFQRKPVTPLIVIMLIIGQFCLMQLFLLGQGVIVTEGREMEDSVYGWYGQLAVLMVYSDWAYFLFSVCFSALLCVKIFVDKYVLKDETEPIAQESTYKNMNMP